MTESTIANLVAESDAALLTLQDVADASACYLLNAVRGFHPISIDYRFVVPSPSL